MFGAQAMANFMISLEIMGLGMVGIFAVNLLIIGIVTLLTRLGGKADRQNTSK